MAPPSEFDLRAALREGEGEGLDADHLIIAGGERRARRRARLLSTAALIALVTGGAIGLSQLGGSGDSGGASSADSARRGAAAAGAAGAHRPDFGQATRSAAANGGAPAPQPGAPMQLDAVACPAAAPAYLLPGGGGLNSYGASGPMFARAVSGVVVCAYGPARDATSTPARHPARLALSGSPARRLVTSMESASTVASAQPCGRGSTNDFAIIGVGSSGQRLSLVTAGISNYGCAEMITNGTAVRYDWSPPPDLARRMLALAPSGPAGSLRPSPSSTR